MRLATHLGLGKKIFRLGTLKSRARGFVLALTSVILASGLSALTAPVAANAANVACASTMTAQNNLQVVPSHSSVFYIDSGVTPKVDAGYVAYNIVNSSASARTNVWVQLSNFAGGKVSLANPADAAQEITIPANGNATAFFLLKASGSATTAQTHTVKVWTARPDISGSSALATCDYSFSKVSETIKASANKITAVTGALSPATATLGGTYTITVTGFTGKIGSGYAPDNSAIWASPAAYSSFPTRALRLESTTIHWADGSCPADVVNQLYYKFNTSDNCFKGNGANWTGTYKFRIIGTGPAALTPSPVANISSGSQYKHSDISGITTNTSVNLSGVASSNVAVNVSASGTPVSSTANSVTIRYLVTISTNSTVALNVDEVIDTHDPGTSFVAGSAKAGTNSSSLTTIADPTVITSDVGKTPPPYHFIGPYSAVSGTPYYIQYDYTIPCLASSTTYGTKVVAYTGDVLIGSSSTSISTSTVTTSSGAACSAPQVNNTTTSMNPSIVTSTADSITSSTANINAYGNAAGASGAQYQFSYATDPNLVNGVTTTSLASITGSTATLETAALTGLSPNTTYYYQALIRDSSGTYYKGLILSFTTAAQAATPAVVTSSATGITGTNVTLNGSVNANLTAITSVDFYYCRDLALTTSCVTKNVVTDDGTGTAISLAFTTTSAGVTVVSSDSITGSQQITTLSSGTTYYYRLQITCAYNATTNAYCPNTTSPQVVGATLSFTAGAPTAITSDATAVGATTATLNGAVNANNASTATSFCLTSNSASTNGVLTTANCTSVTGSPASLTGNTTTAISGAATGLTGNTTYYFQTKATSGSYTSYGSIFSFTTLSITSSTPLSNGQVNTTYNFSFAGAGGSGSYTWSTSSTLPAGLTLSGTGLLSGTPTSAGSYSFDVTMTDPASGQTVTKTFTLVVNDNVNISASTSVASYVTGVGATVPTVGGTASPAGGVTGSLTCNVFTAADTGYVTPVTLTANSAAGSYVVHCTGTAAAGYVLGTNSNATIAVTAPSTVNITATTSAASYVTGVGATVPTIGGTASPAGGISGSLTCGVYADTTYTPAITLTSNTPAGTYLVHCVGTAAAGYVLGTNTNATITVNAAGSVSFAANSASFTTGNNETVPTFSGTANPSAGLSGSLTCRVYATSDSTYNNAITVTSTTAAGNYVIHCTGTVAANYVLNGNSNGTLTIYSMHQAATGAASNITFKSALLQGNITAGNGGLASSGVTSLVICYSTSNALVGGKLSVSPVCSGNIWNTTALSASALGNYSVSAGNLNAGATYYSQIQVVYASTVAQNGAPTAFTILNRPSAATNAAAKVSSRGAIIRGAINPQKNRLTKVSFCWGTDATLSSCSDDTLSLTTWWTDGVTNSDQSVTATLTGLAPHTTYYYRAYTVADDGGITAMSFRPRTVASTAQGSIENFTTAWADTTAATAVAPTSATLNGTLHAGSVDIAYGDVSSVKLCYSTSNALDSNGVFSGTQVCSSNLWTGSSSLTAGSTLDFSAPVTGLTPGQVYYSQIQVVFTSTGTALANGGALQFATPGTVTFHANFGGSVQANYSQTSGITANLIGNTFSRTGYSFAGWATSSNGTLAYSNLALYNFVGATDLYALWTINSYSVVFNNNDGSGSPATSTVAINYNTDAIPSAPSSTRMGYTLVGWNTASNATTALTTYVVTSGTTLYAVWLADTYVVTFDANTASAGSAPGNENFTVGTSSAIALPGVGTMSKVVGSDVYTFGGWSLTAGTAGAGGSAVSSPFTPTGSVTLYAIWQAPGAKTVTFHTNYPSGTNATSSQTSTAAANLAANTFATTGYTFSGWANSSNSTTVVYLDGDSYPFSSDGDLYAVWTPNTYTVTWNTATNGGATNTTSTFTVGSSAINVPLPVARTGYTFTGWYTAAAGGSTFATYNGTVLNPANFTPTASVELFARWTLNSYTISYLKNDGGNSSVTASVSFGSDALPHANPWTRAGYSFQGWSHSATGALITTFPVSGDDSLYAIWAGDVYTVTWDTQTNGGAANASANYTVGGTPLVIPTPSARAGYTFTGWYTLASGGTTLSSYSSGTFNPASFNPSQSVTYFAYWTINSYDVTFNKNDGSGSPATSVVSVAYQNDAIPSAPTYSRAGYTFAGWSTTNTGSTVTTYSVTGAATLFAIWTPNQYTITYDANTGSGTAPNATTYTVGNAGISLPGASGMTLIRNGATYVFGGWSETPGVNGAGGSAAADPYQANSNITLYAIWVAPGSATVTFHSNYPSGSNSTSSQASNAPASLANNTFATTGYSFAGWNTLANGAGTTYAAGANYTFASNLDLYAQWTANQYVVTWNTLTNGGGANTSATFTVGGSAISIPLPASRSGYTFSGWFTSSTGGSPVATYNGSSLSPTTYTPAGSVVLYAQWTAIATHTVTFHANFGSDATTTQQSNTNGNLTANGFTRAGYTFSGWATNPDGTGTTYVNQAAYGFANDLVIYAQWTAVQQNNPAPTTITYQITLEYQGGTGGGTTYWYTVGGPGVLLPAATKSGYVFGGWSTACPGGSVVVNPYVATSNVTLCAVWQPAVLTFTITFNYQGGTGSVSSITYTSASGAVSLPSGSRQHYSISGWSLQPNGVAVASPFTPSGDVTLFAQWAADVYTVTLEANPATAPETVMYTYGSEPISLPSATPINGKFLGWAVSGTRTIISTSTLVPSSNLALYAVYTVPQIIAKVYFKGDSSVLTSNGKTTLKNLVIRLKKFIHVWDVTSTGWVKRTVDTSYDQKLALARAKAVAKYLKTFGIVAKAATASDVVAPQDNATARRVDIVSK